MSTEWIRKHVNPGLVFRYEREMETLRGEISSINHVVENIKKMNAESEKIESEAEIRARELAEDEEDIRYHAQLKHK